MKGVLERGVRIQALDTDAMEQARVRKQQLTKPAGSLGRLEELAIQVAGIRQNPVPLIERKAVIVMAGDHGVTSEGVSAYPSVVTAQMVHNFLRGGAALHALAKHAGADAIVVDVGVAALLHQPDLLSRKVAPTTPHLATGTHK